MRKKAFLHLLNPLSTFLMSGSEPGDAPTGKLRLFDNDKMNLAAWNTIGTAAWMLPAALIVSRLANKREHDSIKKAMAESLTQRLHAARPTISGTAKVDDDISNMLNKELEKRIGKEMSKEASDSSNPYKSTPTTELVGMAFKGGAKEVADAAAEAADTGKEWASTALGKIVTHGIAPALPVAIPALLALLVARAHNKTLKKEVHEALMQDRDNLKREQRAIDRIALESQGLIKAASTMELGKSLLTAPLTLAVLLSAGAGILGYKYFRKADDSAAKVKLLKEQILGSSHLQDTPKLTLAELPVDIVEMTAVPGSTKKETLAIADPVSGAIEELAKSDDVVDIDPILEEVTTKKPKKDAIF